MEEKSVTVSGCVSQPPPTGSLTDDAATGKTVTFSTAGIEANSTEPVNAYVLLNATPIRSSSDKEASGAPTS